MIRYLKNSASAILILLSSCGEKKELVVMPFINQPDFTPEWIDKKSPEYKAIHRVPAFSFLDQDSNLITEKTVTGKIYVADFFFTRCGSICPKMTKNMSALQEHFKNNTEVIFLSHSVLPEMDSVPVLKKYAEQHGIISGKWHLLTGNRDTIYRLARREYFAGDTIGYYQAANDFLHTENFILLDRERRIRGVYNGTLEIEIDRLKEDIISLLKE
jgi:protein SCO1